MTLYNLEAVESAPSREQSLAILSDALRAETLRMGPRPRATPDGKHPEEGLALLKAYLAIGDCKIRQALLDVVVAISERDSGFR